MSDRTRLKIGDTFGTRTVIAIGEKREKDPKRNIYILKCTCGAITRKDAQGARIGRMCEKCRPSRRIGKKTKWGFTWLESYSPTMGKFKCDCGHVFEGSCLRKTCGSPNHDTSSAERLRARVGERIGSLRIVDFHRKPHGYAKSMFLVRCRCGKEFYVITSVVNRMKSCGCLNTKCKARGENVGVSKYTEDKIKTAFELWLSGLYSITEVSKMCALNRNVLYEALNGQGWTHVQVDDKVLNGSPRKDEFNERRARAKRARIRNRGKNKSFSKTP